MIVSYKENGWDVITQRAHGLVAAQLAFQWKKEVRTKRWVETILAIAEHDDVEVELEGENLITSAGGPLDYSMKNFDRSRCERLAMLTSVKSRYIASLISMHMEFLYTDEAKTNTEARNFLRKQKKWRINMLADLGITDTEFDASYRLLQWCDAFSLLLCQRKIPPEHRSVEISKGPDKRIYNMFQGGDNELCVHPWPFQTPSFDITFECRSIHCLTFHNSEDFRKAFIQTPAEEIRWTIRKKTSKQAMQDHLP